MRKTLKTKETGWGAQHDGGIIREDFLGVDMQRKEKMSYVDIWRKSMATREKHVQRPEAEPLCGTGMGTELMRLEWVLGNKHLEMSDRE